MKAMHVIAARKEKGFTLIELVMVIVILGILAAFALPRFADFGGEARVSSINGLAGAMRSASAIAHARQAADNAGPDASVVLEGKTVTMVAGYPTANAAGIGDAAQISAEFKVSAADGGGTAESATITYYISPDDGTAASSSLCRVQYAAANDTSGSEAPTSVTATTTGC